MLNKETMIPIINRSETAVVIRVPNKNVRVELEPRQRGYISLGALQEAMSTRGGKNLIMNYIFVEKPEILHEELFVKEEPEYWLTEEGIPDWMIRSSLNEFKDGLDYAPEGVKGLIKKYAISMPLNDVAKREAILTQLNFDVAAAIRNAEEDTQAEAAVQESASKRRASAESIKAPTESVKVPAETPVDNKPKYVKA